MMRSSIFESVTLARRILKAYRDNVRKRIAGARWRWISCIWLMGVLGGPAAGYAQTSQDTPPISTDEETSGNVAGGYVLLGGASVIKYSDLKMRFAGGFGFEFSHLITDHLALTAGTCIIGKGYRFSAGDVARKELVQHLEFPLGALFKVRHFQIGAAIAVSFAISGTTRIAMNGDKQTHRYDADSWNSFRRINLGARIYGGYALTLKRVALVPGIMGELELLNSMKGDVAAANDYRYRQLNIMLSLGVQYTL